MSSELSVKEFSFISYFLIPDNNMNEEKVGLKVEDGEDKKEEDDDDLEVSDEEVNGTNDDKEEDRSKKTKELMLK